MTYKDNELPPPISDKPLLSEDTKFIVIPVLVVVIVLLLSILVYLLAKRRRMTQMRRNILKLYEFDSHEQEWEPLSSNEYPCYGNELMTSKV